MPRHLTMADIGRGFGRRRPLRRGSRRTALLATAVLGTVAVVGGVAWARPAVPRAEDVSAAATPACTGVPTTLNVAASADKAALLTRFAADYNSTEPADASGRCVQVTVVTKSSGAAQSALAKGWQESDGPRPDVWSPSGSIWLPLLEQRLPDAGRPALLADPQKVARIASSPLVIAMPRPMAEALGWPDTEIGWSDLLNLAKDRTGWSGSATPSGARSASARPTRTSPMPASRAPSPPTTPP